MEGSRRRNNQEFSPCFSHSARALPSKQSLSTAGIEKEQEGIIFDIHKESTEQTVSSSQTDSSTSLEIEADKISTKNRRTRKKKKKSGGASRKLTPEVGQDIDRNMRILVVDDIKLNRKILVSLLTRLGFQNVSTAVNGQVAFKLVTTVGSGVGSAQDESPPLPPVRAKNDGQELFDLVFMDLAMPVMNGFESTAKIQEAMSKKDQPVICAFTASTMEHDRIR
jgi:CheY-like chemotaxis protein